jgi:hypothetical protein
MILFSFEVLASLYSIGSNAALRLSRRFVSSIGNTSPNAKARSCRPGDRGRGWRGIRRFRRLDDRVHSAGMIPADRFVRLPDLLAADADLMRRGGFLTADCRVDVGSEPFFLVFRDGALTGFERGQRLMRSTAFALRASDEAWTQHWKPIPEPGWHDLFALTKRGAASIDGDLRPLLQNLQYFKDLLALPRGTA